MNKFLAIIFLFFINWQLQGQSVPEPLKLPYPAIKEEFQSSRVAQKELRIFEERAMQKLEEWADYMSLVGNSDYPVAMRQQAEEMVLQLFDTNEAAFKHRFFSNRKIQEIKLESLVKIVLSTSKQTQFTISRLQINQALTYQNKSKEYKGYLLAQINCEQGTKQQSQSYQIAIYLKKVKKKFGLKDTWVWELKLGDFELNP